MEIYFVGYKPKYFFSKKHTNYWPWSYLVNTINEIGYKAYFKNAENIDHKKPNIYVVWNSPDSLELIEKYKIHKDSIIIQKLTSFDGSPESASTDWTLDPRSFFIKWHWPQYKKLEKLDEMKINFYAFGAKSDTEYAPVKKQIIDKYKEKIFWIPWGTMTVPYRQIQAAQPIMNGFKYDVGFVGSKWGTRERGNILDWEQQLDPLIKEATSSYIAGKGTPKGPVSVEAHIEALQKSKICPIIHANGWKAEKGIMDRFWTVFSLGRFGVVDNEGILDFYNRNELVLETDPGEYIEKSLYYMKNVEQQKPYIEKILSRIKTEYNQQVVWKNILDRIFKENSLRK